MKTYTKFEVDITCTSKTRFSQEEYQMFRNINKTFDTIEQAREFIADKYNGCKRVKMYQDVTDKPEHSGYIYCFNDSDLSHNSPVWNQQDWVLIRKHEITPIL